MTQLQQTATSIISRREGQRDLSDSLKNAHKLTPLTPEATVKPYRPHHQKGENRPHLKRGLDKNEPPQPSEPENTPRVIKTIGNNIPVQLPQKVTFHTTEKNTGQTRYKVSIPVINTLGNSADMKNLDSSEALRTSELAVKPGIQGSVESTSKGELQFSPDGASSTEYR